MTALAVTMISLMAVGIAFKLARIADLLDPVETTKGGDWLGVIVNAAFIIWISAVML